VPDEIYTDHSGVHVNSEGNEMVAEAILEAVQQEVQVAE